MRWSVVTVVCALSVACAAERRDVNGRNDPDDPFTGRREHMVASQIERRGVKNPEVLRAMRTVRRHLYVPEGQEMYAYEDRALPIGHGVTISQPYIVALMTELADVAPGDRVLEIGTGSGYQYAVLCELGARVYSIEIIAPLAARAHQNVEAEGYGACGDIRAGDGYRGWAEHAPFDAIVITAAPPEVPPVLLEQLADGGKMVVPVGRGNQSLAVLTRDGEQIRRRDVLPVRFVPMVHG